MKKLNVYKFIVFSILFMVSGLSQNAIAQTSQANQATELYASGNYEEAFSAASNCSTEAVCQDLLGRMYYFGNGVDKDEKKSLPWVKKAAASGVPYSKYILAIYLEWGEVIEGDSDLAQDYFADALESLTKLANAGDAAALYFIGHMYYTGYGVEKNDTTARKWLQRSAEKNYADAQSDLEYM